MKNPVLLKLLAAFLVVLSASGPVAADARTDLPSLLGEDCEAAVVSIGGIRLQLEVANTRAERNFGLMGRENLWPFDGMIFAYPHPDHVRFWMKNTPLTLDMLFFSQTGELQKIHANAVPFDRTPIEGGQAVQFVIEVPAGYAAKYGLRTGMALEGVACYPNRAAFSPSDVQPED